MKEWTGWQADGGPLAQDFGSPQDRGCSRSFGSGSLGKVSRVSSDALLRASDLPFLLTINN